MGTCWEPDPGGPARHQPEGIVMTRITVEIAEPTVQLADDGDLYVHWPEDAPDVTLITRRLFLSLIDERNQHRSPTTRPPV